MEVKEAIAKRRSIRKYRDRQVPDSLISELIDAARLAPSGHNSQPGRYYVVSDSATRKMLEEKKIFHQDFVCKAPLIIVCCADPGAYGRIEGMDGPDKLRAVRDLSIASFSLVLRATELGLGTCYIGWLKKEEIKEVLGIPKSYIVPYAVIAGYPAEQPEQSQKKEIDDIIISS